MKLIKINSSAAPLSPQTTKAISGLLQFSTAKVHWHCPPSPAAADATHIHCSKLGIRDKIECIKKRKVIKFELLQRLSIPRPLLNWSAQEKRIFAAFGHLEVLPFSFLSSSCFFGFTNLPSFRPVSLAPSFSLILDLVFVYYIYVFITLSLILVLSTISSVTHYSPFSFVPSMNLHSSFSPTGKIYLELSFPPLFFSLLRFLL